MTTRTKTFSDTKGSYGIFRKDASEFTTNTVLTGHLYDTSWAANQGLEKLKSLVAYELKSKLMVKALTREEGDGI